MRLYNIHGRIQNRNVSKYLINWSKKSRSKLQKRVKDFFKPYWLAHIVYEEFPVYGTRLKVDILNATIKVAIEVNGQIIEKKKYPNLTLNKNDKVEIVYFIGGG